MKLKDPQGDEQLVVRMKDGTVTTSIDPAHVVWVSKCGYWNRATLKLVSGEEIEIVGNYAREFLTRYSDRLGIDWCGPIVEPANYAEALLQAMEREVAAYPTLEPFVDRIKDVATALLKEPPTNQEA